jgi:hypothetical protein
MNSLSWLIYLASLSGSASGFFSFLAVLGAVFVVVGGVLSIMWTDGSYGGERRMKGYEDMRKRGQYLLPRGLLALCVFGSIATILPSQNTIYAIAASEIGERVITDETVKGLAADSTKALQAWIKKQIEPEKTKL